MLSEILSEIDVDLSEKLSDTLPMKPVHPIAELFPLLDGAEFEALVADIRENGLREPITLHPDGSILDGRNRYRACEKAKVEPHYVEWDGRGKAVAFVISKNLNRRHLSTSQRAMIAAKLAKEYDRALSPGLRQHIGKSTDQLNSVDRPTLGEAAALMNVGPASVSDAKQVIMSGDQKIIDAVSSGEITVHAARASIAPTKRQQEQQIRNKNNPNKTRIETNQIKAARYKQLRDGVQAIAGLPDIETMLQTVPPSGREQVGRALPHAVEWLNRFYDKWRETHGPSD